MLFFLVSSQNQPGDPSGWPRPEWSLESSEDLMKRAGIKRSILSISAPGACVLEGKQSWELARTLNDKAAEIRDSKPDTFGFFLTLGNVLDTDEALTEIAYGFDELEADGVCLFTRYDSDDDFGDPNKYIGHLDFAPIWEELNRRKAVVFVHPTHPRDISRANSLLYQPIVDYPHETTRAAMDMLLSGTRSEFPDCQVILSHAGGTLPYLIPRVEALLVTGHHQHMGLVVIPTERLLRDYRSFHFDIALSTSNATIKTLLETGVSKENILFGSDFPYAPESAYPAFLKHWQEADISTEQRRKIHSENAVKMFEKSEAAREKAAPKLQWYSSTGQVLGTQ
ncbi:hypothetical protein CB0940_01848 [Cercospora beticola]|nr:hypothetical protein CB0940_01848 [Cercospora beticola]PIB01344.1 hypothetical protein CB0940_01848 [Cercospora beticola]CAK1354281.1 unnamed protein product [Cercospora beticola]